MARMNISRCSIPAKNGKEKILVKIINGNVKDSRTFKLNAYDRDSSSSESLPILNNDKQINSDDLEPGAEKLYSINVKNVKSKIVFEVIQEKGGAGISISSKNRGPSNVEIILK